MRKRYFELELQPHRLLENVPPQGVACVVDAQLTRAAFA